MASAFRTLSCVKRPSDAARPSLRLSEGRSSLRSDRWFPRWRIRGFLRARQIDVVVGPKVGVLWRERVPVDHDTALGLLDSIFESQVPETIRVIESSSAGMSLSRKYSHHATLSSRRCHSRSCARIQLRFLLRVAIDAEAREKRISDCSDLRQLSFKLLRSTSRFGRIGPRRTGHPVSVSLLRGEAILAIDATPRRTCSHHGYSLGPHFSSRS